MREQQGFSLIELMVALAILVILVTVAIPSFTGSLLRANATSLADSLITSLNYAKSEAISRNARVYLCARNADGSDCLNGAADWNTGWLIRLAADDNTLRDVRISNPNAQVSLADNVLNHSDKHLIFKSSGERLLLTNANAEVTPTGALLFSTQIIQCNNPQLSIRREITLAFSGLITVNPRVECI